MKATLVRDRVAVVYPFLDDVTHRAAVPYGNARIVSIVGYPWHTKGRRLRATTRHPRCEKR